MNVERGLHQAGEVAIHYRTAGTGEPVVLLHGWPESGQSWAKVLPLLAGKYRVIAPDLRGFGESDRPSSGYDSRTVADDVAGLITALGLERPRIVGHDVGGPVGFLLAADPSLRVKQFAFLEAPLYGLEAELPEVAERFAFAWHIPFFGVPHVAEFLIAGREAAFLDFFMKSYAFNRSAITPELVETYARVMRLPGGLTSGLAYYRAATDSAAQIAKARKRGKLVMPVLALGGALSLGDAPLRMMRAVAADVRGGEVPQCGHWLAEERPDELARHLLEFFAEDGETGA